VKLAVAIYGAIDLVRPSAQANNIELVPVLDSISVTVLGDRDRLQQVVFHLLSNAIKFTTPGGRVEIKLEQVQIEDSNSPIENNNLTVNLSCETSNFRFNQTANSYAKITVIDTGVGISAEFLPYVFDRFRQAERANTRIRGGLGLGLATVRQLVELHGGTVYAQSQGEQQGATFTVLLPLL
jgi:signal transduction histidine kinase